MPDPKINDLSLTEVAAAIASRDLSSLEATRACLDRISEHGDALTCIARIDPGAALEAAAVADDEFAAGRSRGPLHGVPLAHKDMFYREGHISACGSRIRAEFIADRTSSALARLDTAGALDIARLNMVEFAVGGVAGHNAITGNAAQPLEFGPYPRRIVERLCGCRCRPARL